MNRYRKILPLFSHFCLALIFSVMANGVLFFHAHELENGQIITHAHPILTEEQENLPDHGHTESELIILDLMAHAEYLVFDYHIPVPEKLDFLDAFFRPIITKNFVDQTLFWFDHRGPPAVV